MVTVGLIFFTPGSKAWRCGGEMQWRPWQTLPLGEVLREAMLAVVGQWQSLDPAHG